MLEPLLVSTPCSDMPSNALILCHECGLLQRIPRLPLGGAAVCPRCGCQLHRRRSASLEPALALTIAGVVLFLVANVFPFLSFEMQGQVTQTTLATGVIDLYDAGRWSLAAVVGFTSILAPGLQLALLLAVLVPLKLGRLPAWLARLFRYARTLAPWGMMDVFMLGILVAVVKLSDMATLVPGTALFAFVVLIFVLAAAQAALDPDEVWSQIPLPAAARRPPRPGEPIYGCHVCELAVPSGVAARAHGHPACPRCGESLHLRKPMSLQRTWALLLAAILLYVPANLYPIMAVTSLGRTQADTILSGVLYLVYHGMWPLALVVFVASVLVPLLKLAILVYLLISVQLRSGWRLRDRTQLYRITEAVGRWSMVDIYVVTILVALVRLGNLATIEAQAGAVFFAAVVVLTMLSAMAFDPRLIWDAADRHHD
jgi:paraquat-inducible protein A